MGQHVGMTLLNTLELQHTVSYGAQIDQNLNASSPT